MRVVGIVATSDLVRGWRMAMRGAIHRLGRAARNAVRAGTDPGRLTLSRTTVRNHTERIYAKTGASNRAAACQARFRAAVNQHTLVGGGSCRTGRGDSGLVPATEAAP
jgi:hypothetical protein